MTDPATGVTAATLAAATSASGTALLSAFTTLPVGEFLPGTMFAVIGAIGWQFIAAQAAREKGAQDGVARDKLPTVDITTLGYSVFGAPLAAGCLIAAIHFFGGTSNFLSLPGFLLAGAVGPKLVTRVVVLFLGMIPSPKSGGQP